ncbi:MAG: efflux RND transporter permease subunit [Armatimonadetes bacterium]|nr:efflux RND transporter permease subunit [Armatimonadota bacterium]
MNFARFSVTRPVAVTMRIAALVLLGAICLTRLPVDLLPKVSLPTVAVSTQWPNVSPEVIEAQVTRPIEQAVSSASNMYQVSSSSREGGSTVRIQFRWGTDIGQAAVDVLQLVQRAQRSFPNDPTLQTPIVFKFDPNQQPILIFGVSGEKDPVKLRTILDNQVSPMVESAGGVASAVVTGGQARAIMVDIDPDRLRAYHLSLSDVSRRIVQENLNLPAGIAKESETEYTIRSLGWFGSIEEMGEIPVGSFNGQLIALRDVADIRDAHQETRLYTRLNQEPAVGLVISKQSDANTVATADEVLEKIEQVKKLYPSLTFRLAYDQSTFIENAVHEVRDSALIGGVLAVLILLFFLRNIRSTLVVALSIPTSIISTFALLYICGFSINTMSLGGLALATGLIVDDAVVVLENIFRHIERDRKRSAEAAVSGTSEIMSAVIASTWTIMVVFLPLLLIKGQAGQMFTQFALVVIFSLAVSLLDATTVVPMLASRLIQGEAHWENVEDGHRHNLLERWFARFGRWFTALDNSYRNGLRWAIRHRLQVIGGVISVSAASFLLVPHIGTELMPQTDSGDFTVTVKLPIGTALEKTDSVMRQVEEIILSNPNVETAFAASGTTLSMRGSTTSLNSNQGSVTVRLKENHPDPTQKVMGDVRRQLSRIPGVRALPNQFDMVTMMMTGGPQNVEINIFGNDLSTLSRLAKEAMDRVKDVPGLENLDVNWQEASPEIQWKVDRQKALQLGVSFSDIATTLNTATNGSIASYYQEAGFQYPIIVQMPESRRKTVPELLNLPITTGANAGSGRVVLLGQVARPVYSMGPSEITRLDRQRYIAVTGRPQGRSIGELQADIEKALSGMQFPSGYYWDWGANQKRRAEEFAGMGLAVVLAIGLIYMLLASQFESFIHPLTVLMSVPLSAIGVILALFLTGRSFGLTAFIGLLMLVGIVVKNGILLVDYTNVLRSRGMLRDEAVLAAGPTRLRPILMTASAAILGMLPIAIGLGSGSEVQAPMATAVIGGLFTSTILTLFIVPIVYTLFDDLTRLIQQNRRDLAPPELVEPSVEAVEREPAIEGPALAPRDRELVE